MNALSIAFFPIPFLLAALSAIGIVAFWLVAFRRSSFGIGALVSTFLFQAIFPGFAGINLGIRVDVLDFISVLIGFVTLLRWVAVPAARHGLLAWYVFVIVVLVSLVSGLITLGTAGGVAARPYFYALVAGSYVLTFKGDVRLVRQLLAGLAYGAVALMALVVARWMITYLPIAALLPPEGRFSSVDASKLRVIPSAEAMLMAQVVVVGIFYPAIVPALRWLKALTPILFITVVILQHRSVWLALTSAILTRFGLPQAGRKATAQIAVMALVLASIAGPLLLSGKFVGATADIGKAASRAAALADTVNFRFDTWRFTINKWASSGPVAVLIGLPMGTSMDRVLRSDSGNYLKVSVSAHNFFVQTIFNTGLVGLSAVLAVYAYICINLFRGLRHPEYGELSGVTLLLTVGQLVYYVAYGVDFIQSLILGVAAALALTISASQQASRAASSFGIRPLALR